MGKILYIRLDSTPLPEASDEIIVKDFNLENYFCTLLGEQLLAETGMSGTMLYPGKLITDFEKVDREAYREIVCQIHEILINLLNVIHLFNEDEVFSIIIPSSYAEWLRNKYNDLYKRLSLENINKLFIDIPKECLYREIIEMSLLRKMRFHLARIENESQSIMFSVEIFVANSRFMESISRCIGSQTCEKIKLGSFPYSDVRNFAEGVAAVKIKEKWGFIDKKRNLIIPNIFDDASSFSEGLAAVKKTHWGYIDKKGDKVIPFKYFKAMDFNSGLIFMDEKIIDKSGNEIMLGVYRPICRPSEGLIAVKNKDNGKCGFINKEGKEIIHCKYKDVVYPFSEGLAIVTKNREIYKNPQSEKERFANELGEYFGVIDKYGNEITPFVYDFISSYSEGMAKVKMNGKFGFIDKYGNEIIPFVYDSLFSYSEGMAKVEMNGKFGFINKNGKQIIPCIYEKEDIDDEFKNGFVWVKKSEKYGLINKDGKQIIPCIYDYAISFHEGWAYVKVGSHRGLVNEKGNTVFFNGFFLHYYPHDGMVCVRSRDEFWEEDCKYNFIPIE